jgi:hypothetical protein
MSSQTQHARLAAALAERLSPQRTRQATLFERSTVGRLDSGALLRLNPWLEFVGKLTTVLWVAFVVSVALGVDRKDAVESALNSGRPVRGALVLVIVLPTLLFIAARSLIGFARWRLQRELWRRDVDRLTGPRE